MAATPSANDESLPMDIETMPNEDHTVHRLLIRGAAVKESNNGKVITYIEGLCLVFQLGEVKISQRTDRSALQVEFNCSKGKAKECVKNITLQFEEDSCPDSSPALPPRDMQPTSSGGTPEQPVQGLHSTMTAASPGQGAPGWSRATETAYQRHQHILRHEASPSTAYSWGVNSQPGSPEFGNASSTCKLPMPTAIQLDFATLEPALHGKVYDLVRMNNLKSGIPINGKMTFEGLFEDVARFYQAVNDLHDNIPGKQNPNRAANADEGRHAAKIQARGREPCIAEEQDANQLKLSFFHYDYLSKVWAHQFSTLQQDYNVDLLPEVVLKLQPKEQRGQGKVKEALEALTKSIQPLLNDLGRVKVVVSDSDRPNVPKAFRNMQTRNPLCCLTELEEGFAITGPRSKLEQVKDELMALLKTTSRPRAALKIENAMTPVMTELEISKQHWEILENLFNMDLKAICSRFQVQIEPDVQSMKEGFRILVKNQAATQDLSANALQAFILLYQKAVTSCITQAVDNQYSNRVKSLYDQKRLNHPDVRLIQAYGGGLSLFGLPHHVELAVRDFEQCLGKKVFEHRGCGSTGATSHSGTSVSSPGNPNGASGGEDEEHTCCICMGPFVDKMTTECKHSFCRECWKLAIAVKPQCPICKKTYGKVIGDQPEGNMTVHFLPSMSLPGFKKWGSIEIDYYFPDGTQSDKHPCPGQRYWGTSRKAYLPDNPEGHDVLKLLQKAFDQKLIFTIGDSRTSGLKNVVTWNDIHHKTSVTGGPAMFGYPDPDYLNRVRDELRAKGIE